MKLETNFAAIGIVGKDEVETIERDSLMKPAFSIVIPAYNEEAYLPETIAAIRRAERELGQPVEIIVADNMSTDGTKVVAESLGAKVVPVGIRCISAVRNRAAMVATGKYLVFQDADNRISPDLLVEIKRVMDTGNYVGGGLVNARYDRDSLGLRLIHGLVKFSVRLTKVSMFLFYTTPGHFAAIGGFDENLYATEDHDFAIRLLRHAQQCGLQYMNLRKGELVMSSRKFDEYGDWSVLRHPIMFLRACLNDPKVTYELWYKPRREKVPAVASTSAHQ